uniref:Uncharacterized protein n=1 Tax=Chromera velia CCMP2878 TaxID=1169474 RepID=A0A0G4FQR7_9ALVE|eukprot:Cvel_18130.t1-p1 / transcript=Cvel_18130.t1 / gene=Cvel_18130 / organism=Chromera_velia_CCMP2878 / gene_product=Gibberellic acid methyltransferase 2, putative / transcript_product=Gibberellic acid methyltransferase 2, putative / location=Cvel_scaffold1487:34826-36614(+) / protein_length=451 / sequence_SO=supercontig / SO=protein_coding / is_pseudo=false
MKAMSDDYNKKSRVQSGAWGSIQNLFAEATNRLKKNGLSEGVYPASEGPLRIADYGCSTGGNSVAPLSFIVSQFMQKDVKTSGWQTAASKGFVIYLCDLHATDWRCTLSTVTREKILQEAHKAIQGEVPSSPPLFVLAAPGSFYTPVVPPCTVDLAYCLVALHWLSSRPCEEGASPGRGPYSGDMRNTRPEVFAETCRIAANDWVTFLRHREKEMAPNGSFLILNVACPQRSGRFPWSDVSVVIKQAMLELADHETEAGREMTYKVRGLLNAAAIDEDAVTILKCSGEAIHRWVLPCGWRSGTALRRPFLPDRVSGEAERGTEESEPHFDFDVNFLPKEDEKVNGLRLEQCEFVEIPCPHKEDLRAGRIDAEEFARRVTAASLAVVGRSLRAELEASGISDTVSDALFDAAIERAVPIVAREPDEYCLTMTFFNVLISKEGGECDEIMRGS